MSAELGEERLGGRAVVISKPPRDSDSPCKPDDLPNFLLLPLARPVSCPCAATSFDCLAQPWAGLSGAPPPGICI